MYPDVCVSSRLNARRVLFSSAGQGAQANPEELTRSEDQHLEQKLAPQSNLPCFRPEQETSLVLLQHLAHLQEL